MTILYNEANKKLIHGFGALFNNITVNRKLDNGKFKQVKIPIHFAPASYDYTDILQHPDLVAIRPALSLPLMTYEITRYDIDNSRKENRYYSRTSCIANADGTFDVIRSPTPYNVAISLYLYTQYLDDYYEVQERIFTGFNPKVVLQLKHDNGITTQVPISITNVTKNDGYEGSPKEKSRLIFATFSFDAKMDFYRVTGEKADVIKTMTLNYKDTASETNDFVATIAVDPQDADISDNWTVSKTII